MLANGLLRVGRRLAKAAMPEEVRRPVILSSQDQVISQLILKPVHQELGHAGRNYMLAFLCKHYWITNANAACRKIISDCVMCRRLQGKAGEQKMSEFPVKRVLPDLPPFTNIGVDYFGPVEINKGRSTVKCYGVISTCMASGAMHLEMAYSLNTDFCINAIHPFFVSSWSSYPVKIQ